MHFAETRDYKGSLPSRQVDFPAMDCRRGLEVQNQERRPTHIKGFFAWRTPRSSHPSNRVVSTLLRFSFQCAGASPLFCEKVAPDSNSLSVGVLTGSALPLVGAG